MTKSNLRLVSRRSVIGTVPPRRVPNAELRTREYLTAAEVDRLIKAAKANRHGHRDATMILLAFRHGLRAAELVDLRWDQVDLGRNAALHVRRVKNGIATTHPLHGDEMRALRALGRESTFVFVYQKRVAETVQRFGGFVAKYVSDGVLVYFESQQAPEGRVT
jgi:integrase